MHKLNLNNNNVNLAKVAKVNIETSDIELINEIVESREIMNIEDDFSREAVAYQLLQLKDDILKDKYAQPGILEEVKIKKPRKPRAKKIKEELVVEEPIIKVVINKPIPPESQIINEGETSIKSVINFVKNLFKSK